jgi:Rps23 Pro-64 3,4-dihydroxylase Tpa1-like proline 4-hydroxylase
MTHEIRLADRWDAPAAAAEVARTWALSGNLRLDGALPPPVADALEAALRAQAFELTRSAVDMYQYWRSDLYYDSVCDHVLCALGRWIHQEGPSVVGRLVGVPLRAPEDELISANLYTKGSYLDIHNDFGKGRAVAFVFGLTRDPWGAEEGGWLEFVARGRAWDEVTPEERDATPEVVLARPPGWNTLDLFDVRTPDRWHRVTIVRTWRQRVTVSGWFYPDVPRVAGAPTPPIAQSR